MASTQCQDRYCGPQLHGIKEITFRDSACTTVPKAKIPETWSKSSRSYADKTKVSDEGRRIVETMDKDLMEH